MKILSIIIFGFALVRCLTPLINKKSYRTFPIFFGIFVNAFLYAICYVWIINELTK